MAEGAEFFAASWGSRLVTVAEAGHLNADSGLGEWQQGKALLQELLAAAPQKRPETPTP